MTRRIAMFLALIAPLAFTAIGGSQQPTASDYGGIDPAVVFAWERAGASLQFLGRRLPGLLQADDERPLFAFRPGEAPSPAGLSRLPQPAVPFGLKFERVLTPEHLKALQPFSQLRELSCRRSDPGNLPSISELKQLDTVRLSFLDVQPTPGELSRLAGLPALRTLSVQNLDLTNANLDQLTSLRDLRSLDLMGSTITDDQLVRLTALDQLQHLNLHDTYVTGRGVGALAALPNLTRLELGGSAIDDSLLVELPKLSQLESLTLWNGTRLSANEPGALATLKRLRALAIYYPNNWSDGWVRQLASLESLESLELFFADPERSLTDAGLAQLRELRNLRSLRLPGAQISDAGLKSLAGLENLRSLDLDQTPITDAGIGVLTEWLDLEEVGLNGAVTDEGLLHLTRMPSLSRLAFSLVARKAVTSAGVRRLILEKPGLRINRLPAQRYPEGLQCDEALRQTEPEARLAALQAIQTTVSSAQARRVDEALLRTLAAKWADRVERVGPVFDRVIAAIPDGSTPIARMDATLPAVELLADLPSYADRVEAALERALDGLGAAPPLRGLNEPRKRAAGLALLGRARLAGGRIVAAQRAIEQSLTLMPLTGNQTSGTLVATLAQIKTRRGDTAGALDSYLSAAAAVTLTATQDGELRALYRSVHGSEAGLEAEVARRHRTTFPNPVKPTRFDRSRPPGSRVVLFELFSGAGCRPCWQSDLGVEGVLARYAPEDVAVVVHHLNIPLPDPMVVEASNRRSEYYGIEGNPYAFVDGRRLTGDISGGEVQPQDAYQTFASAIDGRLEAPTRVELSITATGAGDRVTVHAKFGSLPSHTSDLRLHIVLVERDLGYVGESRIRQHAMVVRAAAGANGGGLPIAGSESTIHTFSLESVKADVARTLGDEVTRRRRNGRLSTFTAEERGMTAIDPSQLVVVAFVQQGDATAQPNVLQAAQADVSFSVPEAGSEVSTDAGMQPSAPAQVPAAPPVTWSLALAANARPAAGSTVNAIVTAKIEAGWHVYSMTQAPNGPSALLVDVPGGQPFSRAAAVMESLPVSKFDPNFKQKTDYFEKTATLTIPVRIAPGSPAGTRTLRVTLDYQVCSDRLCLPPAMVELMVDVTIREVRVWDRVFSKGAR